MLYIFRSFFMRDLRQALSYRFAFILDIASVFFTAATFYFVARLFEAVPNPSLESYGGQYFPFVLIGIAFSTYQSVGLNSFSQSLRNEQYMGTLEPVLATPVRISTFLSGSALWDFFYATLEVFFYFLIAFAVFGFYLPNPNWPAAALAVTLTLTTFMGLGVLAAGFILRFKRGNPVTWAIASASELLGGVYFPITLLPDWLRKIADWVPMSHALEALRKSLLVNAGIPEISRHLLFLAGFTVLVWPLGVLVFRIALRRSQRDGTLGHY